MKRIFLIVIIAACMIAAKPCILKTQIIKDSSLLVKIIEYTSRDSIVWDKMYQENYSYNKNGLLIKKSGNGTRRGDYYVEDWPGNRRFDFYRDSYDYLDSIIYNNKNQISEIYHFDNNSPWIEHSLYSYCPDDSVCEINKIRLTSGSLKFIEQFKTEFIYDKQKIMSKIFYHSIDSNLNIPEKRFDFIWKNNDLEFDIELQQFSNGNWGVKSKTGSGKFSNSGILLQYRIDSSSYSYGYNFDSTGKIVSFGRSGGDEITNTNYDYLNNLLQNKHKKTQIAFYPEPPAQFVLLNANCHTIYYYDKSDKITTDITIITWDPIGKAFDKTEYSYNNFTVEVKEEELSNSGFEIYPNPATSSIPIHLPPEYQTSPIKIYSVEGIEVYNVSGSGTGMPVPKGENIKIDVISFSPGVYYVKVGDRVCRFVKI